MKKLLIIFFVLLSVAGFAQTVTPVLYPQYMEGVGNGNVADLRSVPYACRMTLDGLIPNRLYYYYNRFVLNPASTSDNGQGTIIIPQSGATPFQRITAPNLSASGTAGTFTTDANGSYTGWFITEPTAAPEYFPGSQVYWRIMLRNDQFAPASAVELRLTAPLPVRTLQWLGYAPPPGTPPAGFVGTLVTRAANTTDFTPKNFVMLYDNVAGTGRPIGGTFVEDDLLSVAGLGYIASYPNGTGAAQNGRWGAIIPSGTPQGPGLANGIRNISQFSFANGSLVNVCNGNSAGTFGAINTVNHVGTQPNGVNTLNIAACGTPLANCNNLSLSTVITGTACNASTGAIDLTVSGGTAPYTYLWSNGATTQDISGVPGGNYTVTVTDATNVCTSVAAATVSTTQLISLSAAVTNASACANNSGAIDLIVNGAVGPYTYLWSNGATSEDLTGIAAGTYTVTVTGAGTCAATATYTVTQAAALSATASGPAIPNCGTTTTVLVSATGGTAPYTGIGSFTVTAGTYNYTITDARGCTATATVTVAPATCVNAVEVIYPKYVQGVGTGSPSSDLKVPYAARITLTGLTANATYRYFTSFTDNPLSNSNGASGAMILANQTGDFTRITSTSVATAGEYGEFTTNGSGSYTGWYVIEPGSDIIYSAGNLLYLRLNLNNGAGGSTVATRVTTTNPVTVINWGTTSGAPLEGSAIYNVANTAFTPKNFVMLYDNIAGTGRPVSGTYVESDGTANTGAEGYDLWYELNVEGQANVWGTIIPNNLGNGINNISQYALSDGSFVNKCTSPDGVYGTTDTKNASVGNDAFGTLLVIDCTPTAGCSLAGTTSVTNVLCFGAATGAVNLTVTGATAPTFAWTGPGGFTATTEDISGLIAGTYNVTITDGSCTTTATAIVTQPAAALVAASTATTILCNGGSSTVTVSATGGTAPYTGTGTFSRTAGTYTFPVTDANGCATTTTITIAQPAVLVAASTATAILCNGGSSTVTVSATGGTAPYTGTGTFSRTAGTYTFNVSDANGCTATTTITIAQPAALVAASTATAILCNGGSSTVTVSATGGTAPYTGTGTFSRTAGTYTFNITDANGCTASTTITIAQPAALVASSTATAILCNGGSSTVTVSATGGTAPYTGTGTFSRTAGTYTFNVTDANGCTASTTITISQPTALTATATSTPVTTIGGSNGTATAIPAGGTAPYTYLWTPGGQTTATATGLTAGSYSVLVTDANGCTATATTTVGSPACNVTLSFTQANVLCFGAATGSATVTAANTTGTVTYLWSNGQTTATATGLAAGTYTVTVTDGASCTASGSVTITQPTQLVAASTATAILCNGGSSTVTVSATGGTAPYTGTGTFSRTAGTYTFTVTDANGCTATTTITIAQPAVLVATSTAPPITVVGGSTTVTVSATGGTAPYTGTGTFVRTAGTYTFTVTDANGCTATTTITLAEPGCNITLSTAVTNVVCFGQSTGAINLTVTGAVAPITYLWSNGATTEDLTGITAGTYSVTVTDGSNCTATASATVIVTDNIPPTISFNQTSGVTGPSSSRSPYLQPLKPGVKFTSILTVPDQVAGYQMVGIPDGLGAFDNGNGTFTLLMNHELGNTVGVARAHGGIGAFVSKWVINKTNLQVISGSDLMQQVYNWNSTTQSSNTTTSTIAFNRFCSADLPAVSAFYNAGTGLGSQARIFMHGEEGGAFGYQLATVATGADAGKAYILGKFNFSTNGSGITAVGAWENALANPFVQNKTIVIGLNDGGTGIMSNSLSVYQGTKTNTGSEVDKAGLTNGTLKSVLVTGNPVEVVDNTTRATNITSGTAFTLSPTASTTFSRPEDGLWNPANPSQFFFVTTDRYDQVSDGVGTQIGRSRLWRLNFTDITNPDLGGTIDLLLDGTEGGNMYDNMGADNFGNLLLQEDVGGQAHNGKIWQYNIATDQITLLAKHDQARFGDINSTPSLPYNNDEESSGIIDASDILGAGMYLLVDQAHYNTGLPASVVEGGQLLAMFIPSSVTAGTASDTVRVCAGATGVNLGTPATADNCAVASVTNNAPATFPAGNTNVIWTVTDSNGNTATGTQVVVASAVTATATSTNLTCAGTGNDGTATVVATGGTGTYTYSWSPSGGTGYTATGLAAGTYTVTVTDGNGCTATATAIVRARFAATSTVGTLACNDVTGQVTVTPTGGTAPYTATGTTAGITPATQSGSGALIFTVPFGAYSFNVTDATGCLRVVTGRVAGPLVVSANAGTIACGQTTTTVTVSASQGIPPYSGTGNFTVPAGAYSFTVTDSRGCTATITGTIAAPLCYTVAEVYYPKYVQGVGTGSPSADTKVPFAARMTIGGLTPGATYRYFSRFVDNPASALSNGIGDLILVNQVGNFSRVTSASMNTAGEYGEFTADGSGSYTGWFIQEPGSDIGFTPGNQLYWRIMLNDGAGGNTVAARVTAANPVTVLNFGSTATDGTGLRRTATPDYTAKNFVMLYNNTAGTGRPEAGTFIESDGTANTVANGYAPFYANSVDGVDKTWGTIIPNNLSGGIQNISQYALSNGSFVNACVRADGVFGGTTDTKNANGGLTELVITSCDAVCNVTLSFTQTNVLCFGASTGTATVTAANTTGAVTYLWSNGQTTATATGLAAGTYTVTVTNASCTATGSVTITQPAAALTATAVGVGLTCSTTGNNGTVTLTVSGGTSPYTYLWSNGATTQNLASLAAGTYSVTVTDANGCTTTASATILARFAATSTVGTLACNDVTGQVTVTPTGGTAPYTATGTTAGITPATQSGSGALIFTVPFGAYSFNVTDATGCLRVVTGRVAGPLVVSANAGTIACGQTTTTVTVSASQGIPPYSGTGNFTVPAGAYSFTVTDSRGCTATITGTIAAPLCYTVAEVYYPKYVQGVGTGSPSADTKVPFAARMTIGGLTPGATYRYFSRFVDNPASALSNGIGDLILVNQVGNFSRVTSASMNTAGEYGEFTADGSGSYTGWFIQEPGSDIGFTPGNQLYWRIMLNDGAGGNTVAARVTAANPVTVLNFGSTATDGTGLRRTATPDYTAKNFVMLYNNTAGTGRPEAGTFIESDGTANTVANGYAPFYANSVDGVDKTWGTIIPNNLSGGIQNISQYALSNGSFVNACVRADGVFGGTTDTKNANGGLTELVITSCDAVCNVTLSFTQTNVLCFGASTGTATVTAANTTGAVTYLWSNGQTTATATGLAAGTYTVTVTNASCTATGSVTITQPTQLTITASAPPILCFGGSTTVTLVAAGGTAPYTYSSGTPTPTRFAGTYTYIVTDANGCTASVVLTITQPTQLVAASTATAILCSGGSSTVTVSATGGTAPYTGTGTFSRTAGTYTFTVTDANGCTAVTTITIAQPAALVATSTATAIACNGGSSTVTISATGGTAPYTGTGTFSRTAGTYTFTVTDANGCTAVTTITIAQPAALVATSTATAILCNGGSSTVTVSATGGTAPYTGTGTFSRTAGTYTFTVTDARGCTAVTTITIAQPAALVATSTATAIACNGGSSTVTVSATGGTAPYTGTGTFSRTAGTYTFTVTDANGCTATTSITITQPAAITAPTVGAITQPTCALPTGSVVLSGLPATGTWTLTRTPGGVTTTGTGTSTTISGLAAGTYTFTVTNAAGCISTASANVVINAAPGAPSAPTVGAITQPTCALPTGSVVLSGLPATGTWTLTRTPGGVTTTGTGTSTTISGLAPGTYTFTVTNAAGCTSAASANVVINVTTGVPSAPVVGAITQPACFGSTGSVVLSGLPATGTWTLTRTPGAVTTTGTGTSTTVSGLAAGTYTFTVAIAGCTSAASANVVINAAPALLVASSTATAILCNGGSSTVTVSATGGTAPYTGTGTFSRTAGTYTFTVTDSKGCTAVTTITIAQPAVLVAASTATAIACNGGSSTVTVSATGGTAPYTGTGTFSRTAGTYTFTVTDANGCTAVTSITIAQPAALVATSTATAIACNGGSSTVTISATGGTAPYTGTGSFSRTAGTYTFTVTDARGCTAVTSITIAQPAALVATSTATAIACNGGSSTVTVSATGGTAPYTGTGTFSRTAGTYSFTVTDAKGCTAVTSITIAQPAVLTVTTSSTAANSGSNGTATATPAGGTAPYTYLWTPGGQTTQTATGLAAGNYTVVVTDSKGCTATATVTVASNGCSLVVNAGPDKTLCSGASVTLAATVSGVSAGLPAATPFTEVSGSTTELGLFSGNIDYITIGNTFSQSEDRNNCGKNATSSKTLTIPTGAVIKRAFLHWSGSGALDNMVSLNGTSVTANTTKTATRSGGFSYFAGSKDVTSLVTAGGTYTVSNLNWSNGSPYCYDNSAFGGWALTVIYEKSTLPSARIHVNTEKFVFTFPAGTYSTTINNISVPAGCTADAKLTIVAFEGDSYKGERFRINGVLDADTNNFRGQAGPNLDIITKNAPSIVGGTTSLTYSIESYATNTVFGLATEGLFDYVKVLKYNNCPAPGPCNVTYQWKRGTTIVGSTQSISVNTPGTYQVTATDCKGCIATDEVVVTASTLAATSTVGAAINCFGGTTTVTIAATGGTAPYTGTGTFTKGAGTWNFTVTDAAGCSVVRTVTITQPTQLVTSATAPAIPFCGTTTTVTVTATGGTAPYTGTGTFVRGAGTYTFTVTDSKGCTASCTITIAAPQCGPVNPNKCYKLVNRNSGKLLSIAGCTTSNGALAEQQTSSTCTTFKFALAETGFYQIINVKSGKALDVNGASTADNANIVQYTYGGGNNQKWSLTASGAYFVIKAKHSGKAMSVKNASTSNGAQVVQKGTGSNTNEQWQIVEVACGAARSEVEEPIVEVEEFDLNAYPNPSNSYFNLTIKTSDNTTPVNVRIVDVNGKVISLFPNVQVLKLNSLLRVDASRLAAGVYFAEVTQGDKRKTLRLVKVN